MLLILRIDIEKSRQACCVNANAIKPLSIFKNVARTNPLYDDEKSETGERSEFKDPLNSRRR